MNPEQANRIATAFAREAARSPHAGLCTACVSVLSVTGVGITVMGGGRAGPVCVSNPGVAALEDLQFTLGVGPCQDAFKAEHPILAASFDDRATMRWPAFVSLAQASDIGAVFAYPLMAFGAKVGVLTLYQQAHGDLTPGQHQDSLAVAEVLTETVLSLQDEAPWGILAPSLDDAVTYRAEIYQASGMVAVQLQIPVSEALVRLRARAFSSDTSLGALAAEVVARRIRFTEIEEGV